MYINTLLAKKLGIKFPLELIEEAILIPGRISSPGKI
jgi:hypothetical protein